MTDNPQQELRDLKPENEFFIGFDSDGCVFDTMEIKQKECFCPNVIKYYGLQNVSKYARETWEFVNLYSKTRGINRFLAVIETIKLLGARPEVKARGTEMPDITPLIKWTESESKLGNPTLAEYVKTADNKTMDMIYEWSLEVNRTVEGMVYGIAPFPFVKDTLTKIQGKADALVVSQTPVEALEREWKENNIDNFVRIIAGQEYGTKTEHLALAAKGKYADGKILMIGDAPGDLKAAQKNDVMFYPINPGHEEESWERFYKDALGKFFEGTYAGDYEKKLVEQFNSYLPEFPSWK